MIKVIIITISSTVAVGFLLASMFLNSILGVFGLVSTSMSTFNNLQESKRVMNLVKKRHNQKKLNMSKKFVKRSSKKVVSSAVSAATIGTAAVVVTVAGLEVVDYCEDKKELNEDENILFTMNNEFDYSACVNDAQNDSTEIIVSIKNEFPKVVDSAWESTKAISVDTWLAAKNTAENAWVSTSDDANEALETLVGWASE